MARALRVEIVQVRIGMETMSTILEMAETIRSAEADRANASKMQRTVDLYTKDRIRVLCELFGTTPWGLSCALESVGSDPMAIGQFLRSRESSRSANGEPVLI